LIEALAAGVSGLEDEIAGGRLLNITIVDLNKREI